MGYVDQTTTRERPAIGDTADAETRGRISCNSGLTGAAEGRSPRYA
jgi:hypothetical protein